MKRLLLLASLWLAALPTVQAQGTVPKTIAYMGFLTDSSGEVVGDGDHAITFRLYEQAVGGVAVWETTRTLTTSSGQFSVVLGEIASLEAVPFDRPYLLGISIGGGDELAPRIALVAAPYSLHAKSVEDGSVLAVDVADGQVVKSLNGAQDEVTLVEGANITIEQAGQNITISASGGSEVGVGDLADNSVTGAKIVDASITASDLANDAVTAAKIASGAAVTSVNAATDGVTIEGGGDVTVATVGNTVTISATGGDLADDAVTSAKIADGTVATVDLADDAVTATQIAADAVATAEIQDAAVTGAKLATGSAVLSLNDATDAVNLVPGANVTIDRAGPNITIGTTGGNEVGTGDIADNSITSAKILDSAVSEADLATDAVTSAKIVDGTIVAADLAAGAVTTTQIADATITATDLATDSVDADEIAVDAVGSAELGANAVTSAEIGDGTILAADIAVGQVVTSVNNLEDAITLAAGSNINITPAGNTLPSTPQLGVILRG